MSAPKSEQSGKAEALAAKGKYKRALTQFLKAGDYRGAAQMYEKLGQVDQAVTQYSKAGQYTQAGEALATVNRHEEAARMYAKGGDLERAGEMMVGADKLADAARLFEKAGVHDRAAELYVSIGRFEKAAHLFEASGNRDEAIQVYEDNDRLDLAAKLCMESGDYAKAAQLFTSLEMHMDAANAYVNADLKEEAIAAFEEAGALIEAVALCEELNLQARAAAYHEKLGNLVRAAECYRNAEDFEAAGRIFEAEEQYFDAARMYERGEKNVARAAELFCSTYASESVWDYETKLPIWDIAPASEGKRIAVCLAGPEVHLLNDEGELVWEFRIPMGVRGRSVAITRDASKVAVGTEGRSVYLLDAQKELLWKRELGGEARGLAFCEEEGLLVAGCTDGKIRALDMNGKDVWTVTADYKVWHLRALEDQKLIVAGSGDGFFHLLDFSGAVLWKQSVGDWVSRVSISADGRYIAVVLGQDKLHLYDVEDRALLWEYESDSIVQHAEFWQEKRLIVGCNTGSFMLNFDKESLWRNTIDDRVMRIAVGGDGETLYFGQFEDGLTTVRLNDCLMRAARSYEKCEDFAKAAALYEEKNELRRAMELYIQIDSFAEGAALAEKLGSIEQAGDLYEKAEQFAKAARCFEQVNLMERAALCFNKAGQKSQAGRLLAGLGDAMKAAELHMQSGDLLSAGRLFVEAGALDEAEAAFELMAEDGDLPAEAAVNLGQIYLGKSRLDDAIKLLQPITHDEDHGREALKLLADCFMKKGLFSLSADHFKEALGEKSEPDKGSLDTHYGLACAYEQAGKYDDAKEVFNGILAVDYYYKDVTGRIEGINDISSIFSSGGASGASGIVTELGEGGANQTIAQPRESRYEVIKKIGEGGMGIVYKAKDKKLEREVAWKVLPRKLSKDKEFQTRFIREARAVAALNHKNIVAVYDIGEEFGESFIAMEFIDGPSLREILVKKKTLTVEEVLDYGKQIAQGLGTAHRRGIIHRDIKPENVMVVAESNEVKVMDFGLARVEEASNLTQEGAIMGTWRYMAPEQVTGKRADSALDVYAVGIMLFEMLTGSPPFTEGDLAYHQVNTAPPEVNELLPDVPDSLNDIVKKCLEKEIDARYADGFELFEALETVDVLQA